MASSSRNADAGRPQQTTQSSLKKRYSQAVKATATFFGLSPDPADSVEEAQKWEIRRAELLRRRFGNARNATVDIPVPQTESVHGDQVDFARDSAESRARSLRSLPLRAMTLGAAPPQTLPLVSVQGATPQARGYHTDARAVATSSTEELPEGMTPMSVVSFPSQPRRMSIDLRRKESVSSMALNSIKQAVLRKHSSKRWDVAAESATLPSPMESTIGSTTATPISPVTFGLGASPLDYKSIIAEEGGHADEADSIRPHRALMRMHLESPSVDERHVVLMTDEELENDHFFNLDTNFFKTRGMLDKVRPPPVQPSQGRSARLSTLTEISSSVTSIPASDETDVCLSSSSVQSSNIPQVFQDPKMISLREGGADSTDGLFDTVVKRKEQSAFPFRFIARLLGRDGTRPRQRKQVASVEPTRVILPKQQSDLDSTMLDSRAYFTYYVTLVHIVIFLFSVFVYGIAPIGFDVKETRLDVMREWGVLQPEVRKEPENIWIGPSQASLVHLGARYSPCMRKDANVNRFIESERSVEEQTGCCIRNDRTGCIQTTKDGCQDALSTWLKWENGNAAANSRFPRATHNYTDGPVCGIDPEYCINPASVTPFQWSPQITKWPICTESVPKNEIPKDILHMHCDIIGRPCCVGLVGQCILTTREFCEFQNGYFHQEAFLCSQVSCLGDVCGMIPFADDERPDQFYRLWTPIFLHAGVIHLLISIAFQWTIMRHLEKYAGWLRISCIFIFSGIVGNLASAIFTPYHAEAGPTGSHFGLIASLVVTLIVDIINYRKDYRSPLMAVLRLVGICFALFAVGLLPFIDNWAHVFGFTYGAILSCLFLPDVAVRGIRRVTIVIVSLLLAVAIPAGLVLLFYYFPVYDCEACAYFNCIPFYPSFCATRRIQLPSLVKT